MAELLAQAIVDLAAHAEPNGISIGRIVDALEQRGHPPEVVERVFWDLLGQRRLTPCGFICRKVRRQDTTGEVERARSYELLFVPWSEQQDRQLDLVLPDDADGDEA